ncbi:CDP-diacylglycerol--glycerol-3-phosphate 3-phosphatidyltransferase [Amylibacter kogurei]|uniref:CDP-diacylglycerol--glycerol-3-phosphate 3-phosphatidyltransferase n=1 Tax=Paramylibacter kogurei TaxID=1889778 RepID=A0A2G5K9C8_9RHOB|nr:CDP-diacylglycerol--glycerol-3-phosphate 3-phosphatidyltransferase [Amylibacter kogurei]PIB26146.1 CDP-diacylglycerol--glycerol-3-phosphate 3-phosphatidyltransferase [Amylibacter kogurei]
MNWNIPNILTLLRLLAAPGVAIMFLYFTRPWADWFALVLFVSAAVTDFFDGYLARKWNQESNFGRMMDPIADKAMVVIALMVLVALYSLNPWILLPATLIVFREVFVSGLREFLGADAEKLQVTKLAKWKTTAQMIAIAVLFAKGVFEHYYIGLTIGMDDDMVNDILSGKIDDELGLVNMQLGSEISFSIGRVLLGIAAVLTLITGYDYFQKSIPYLRDDKK